MKYIAILLLFITVVAEALEYTAFPPAHLRESQLVVQSRIKDVKGNIHTRYIQTFQGIPVYGYQLIEHEYAPRLQASAFPLPQWTGVWVENIALDVNKSLRKLSPEAALKHVQNAFVLEHGQETIFKREVAEPIIYIDKKEVARYAVNIHFFADVPEGGAPSWPHYIVDNVTGEVLEYWEGLQTEQVGTGPGGNNKVGYYEYGVDFPSFDVLVDNTACVMANAHATTIDMSNTTDSAKIFSYPCNPATQTFIQNTDAVNGAFSPLNDAYVFSNAVVQMYQDWYGQTPIPTPFDVNVHYGYNYANAFWDGYSMTFGDGDQDFFPLTTLDVVSHEIAHGVTQYASELVYTNQPGGLNESFSDIAAKAAEFYYYGEPQGWTIGGGVIKAPNEALRYMDNPPLDGDSIGRIQDFKPFMDPHHSSGVFNKAFYVLATTPGWDVRKAFDVFYAANLYYWDAWASFTTAAYGVIVAAAFLEYPYDDVINALKEVGITCNPMSCYAHES